MRTLVHVLFDATFEVRSLSGAFPVQGDKIHRNRLVALCLLMGRIAGVFLTRCPWVLLDPNVRRGVGL